MSFSKIRARSQSGKWCVAEYFASRCAPNNIAKEYMECLKFERDCTFMASWPSWKSSVNDYYSSDTGYFMDLIKHHNVRFYADVYQSDNYCIPFGMAEIFIRSSKFWNHFHPKQYKTLLSEIKYSDRLYYPGDFELIRRTPNSGYIENCDCCKFYDNYIYPDEWNPGWDYFAENNPIPYKDCQWEVYHMLNIYIPLIMAIAKRAKRSLKRYYYKLIRVLYSVNKQNIDWDKIENLIFDPPQILPRNLLTYMYERHYFDYEYNQQKIIDFVEHGKHFREKIVEQGGAGQSVSADLFHNLASIYKEDIYEQGLGMKMVHEFSEEERERIFHRFEETLMRTQESFMTSLKESLLEISHYALTLFIIIGTIALLGYSLVRLGEKVIFGTLNLIYRLLCGGSLTKVDTVIQQGADGISIPLLPALIIKNVIAPPAKILSDLWNNPQTDKVMRRIGYVGDPKIHRGISNLTEWMHNMITTTINWFSREILGLSVPEDINKTCSPVEAWYEECDSFLKSYWDQTMQWNDSTWSVCMNLYGKGTSLARQKVFEAFKQDIYKILFKLANILEKFNTRGRSGNSVRNPPVTIYMAGGTGVGKSSVTYPLAAEILKGIFQREKSNIDLKKCWKNLIYMRSSEQEYWDGYENQLVTVFDDFNQMVDSSGNPNIELFEVIRASNSFPYPLHMASLDQKATTTFSSKIILVSSNLEQPKSVSLNFPEALWRRFDLSIRVSRKPGAVVTPGKFDPTIYNFQRYDMSTQTTGEWMSYKEVVYYAVTEYFKRKTFVDSTENYIKQALADLPDPEETITQQGIGRIAGTCVNYAKTSIQNITNNVKQGYADFKDALEDRYMCHEMTQLQIALDNMKTKIKIINEKWQFFKIKHPYMAKTLEFIGLATLVFASIKLLMAFTSKEKKDKVMSMEQFIKSSQLPEECDDKQVKKIVKEARSMAESYSAVQVKPIKVESYNPIQVKPLKVESGGVKIDVYSPEKEAKALAEGIIIKTLCPHALAELVKNQPYFWLTHTIFIKSCDNECPNALKPEGVKDINANEILGKIISSNFYKLYISHNDQAIGHGMFIRGRIFMCPKHYIQVIKKLATVGGKIYFKSAFLTRSFEVTAQEIVDSYQSLESPDEVGAESRDIMAFPVRSATVHSNIEPFFANKNSLAYVMQSQVLLPVVMESSGKNPLPFIGFHFTRGQSGLKIREVASIHDEEGNTARKMRDLWEYSMDTKTTFCGAPLIVRNTQIAPGKIIGMHVAGTPNTGLGFSTPIYQEDIQKILKMFKTFDTVEFRQETQLGEYPVQQSQVPKDSEFIRLGSVQRAVAQPVKSKIIPSPLYNKIREPKTRPCALRPTLVEGRLFDPREYRLKRLGNFPETIDPKLIHFAKLAVIDELSTQIPRVDMGTNIKNVYTFEEAVTGIDGEPYINAIKRNTSPGYPFVHMAGFSNRKEIFGDDEKCDMERPQAKILEHRVKRIFDMARQNIAIEHIFMDTLKDERKPLHKFHKTRLFSAGPIDYLIACKQYFNGIVAVLQKSRNLCHISVGTDHNTQDWSTIVRELTRKSDFMIAGDFEGFDASQSMPLLEAAGDVLIALSEKFCGSTREDAHIMKILLIGLFNSVHVTDHEVYQWTHSLPSGHYLTAIINSVFVLLVFCICWMLARAKTSYMTARSFFQKCGIVAYGDDHVVSVPLSFLEIFNQQTIPGFMKIIGLGYTMEDKDREVDVKCRPITQVSYLKRSFVFDNDRQQWIAPISLDTILESPMWIHKCPDKITQTMAQLDNQLRELSLHDAATWDKWASVFAELGKQFGHYTEYVYQAETRAAVLDN